MEAGSGDTPRAKAQCRDDGSQRWPFGVRTAAVESLKGFHLVAGGNAPGNRVPHVDDPERVTCRNADRRLLNNRADAMNSTG